MQIMRPTLENLQRQFQTKADGYHDKIVKPSYLSIAETQEVEFTLDHPDNEEKQQMHFSESALGQILNRVQIPALFFRRCPPDLQVANFEYFNKVYNGDYFFRFNDAIQKGHVRAVLSDQYSVIDDTELFQIIFESLKERTDIAYRTLQYDDRITQLIIDFNDCRGEFNGTEYVAGLTITNSETGHSSVWIEPVVHIPTASFYNRRALRRQSVDCRIVHRGKLASERVKPMVKQAKEIAQVGIIQLVEAFQTTITRDHALRAISNINGLPNRFAQIMEEEWAEQQDIVKAEAARRIILFAQDLPLFQKIQIEQAAGQIVGLFSNYKTRFQDLAIEMNNVEE